MPSNRTEIVAGLVRDARAFRLCGPSEDPDEQSAVTIGYHHLLTQLKHLASPFLSGAKAARLNSLSVDVGNIYSVYAAKAELDALLVDIEDAIENPGEHKQNSNSMNIRLLAIGAGDALKYDSTVNEIDRLASAIFPFKCDEFPHDSITSVRAKRLYNWLMSLGTHRCTEDDRQRMASAFLLKLTNNPQKRIELLRILEEAGVKHVRGDEEILRRFDAHAFHAEVFQHCRVLFGQGHFFHAVFEASKIYNKSVREKAGSTRDGEALMLAVWGADTGVLKVTPCVTETDKNVQEGIRFLSAGLMRAVRNPTAHEPAQHWPITEQDAADILSFVSFLFRQLDKAVKHP